MDNSKREVPPSESFKALRQIEESRTRQKQMGESRMSRGQMCTSNGSVYFLLCIIVFFFRLIVLINVYERYHALISWKDILRCTHNTHL